MNESNPPVYLPSGYLICERAKQKLIADSNSGHSLEFLLQMQRDRKEIMLQCPFTERVFAEADLRKVFFS